MIGCASKRPVGNNEVEVGCNDLSRCILQAGLLRKYLHTQLKKIARGDDALDKVAPLLAYTDRHTEKVARDIYSVSDPTDDAEAGKALYEIVWGEPVAWPSDEEMFELTNKRSAFEIKRLMNIADVFAKPGVMYELEMVELQDGVCLVVDFVKLMTFELCTTYDCVHANQLVRELELLKCMFKMQLRIYVYHYASMSNL